MYRADRLHGIIHSYCIKKLILKTKRNLKINPNLKSYLENPSKLQQFVAPSSGIEILSFPSLKAYGIPKDFNIQSFPGSCFD
jgi:hypothetical protein